MKKVKIGDVVYINSNPEFLYTVTRDMGKFLEERGIVGFDKSCMIMRLDENGKEIEKSINEDCLTVVTRSSI